MGNTTTETKNTLKRVVRYDFGKVHSICDYLELASNKFATMAAITDRYNDVELNYAEYMLQAKDFASGLQGLGIKQGDIIGLFSENNGRWIIVDQGILRCGAVDAVRGSNAPIDELDYIIGQSDSCALVLQTTQLLEKLCPYLNKYNLKFVVVMFAKEELSNEGLDFPVYSFEEILAMGKQRCFHRVEIEPEDMATILYTSGTTGNPKGVMLCHGNFLYQLYNAHPRVLANPGERSLQIIPIWHAYERVCTYYYFAMGCHMHNTTLSNIKDDILRYKPTVMTSVPRIWESVRTGIYTKLKQKSPFLHKVFSNAIKISTNYIKHCMYVEQRITEQRDYNPVLTVYHAAMAAVLKPVHTLFYNTLYKKLKDMAGLNIRVSISGGGALSTQDEFFYEAIGVTLLVGYGLTETSPILTVRSIREKSFICSSGFPFPNTEIKIINPETKKELPLFEKGLVVVRGPQVMLGYYNDEAATRKVLDENGWFITGDLGYMTNGRNLVIQGRLKETIVLSNGENVEPIPIEDAVLNSPYINQIVLVGQDKNAVGALVIPTKEALEKCGVDTKGLRMQKDACIKNPALRKLIKNEIDINIKNKSKLKSFEKIQKFELLKEGFSIDNGLMTSTAKIKRNKVFEKYKDIISGMYQ